MPRVDSTFRAQGSTALMLAAREGKTASLKELLDGAPTRLGT